MIDDDLSVFFDTDDFAHECTRKRDGVADLVFPGILGLEDQAAMQGYSIAAAREILIDAEIDLFAGDRLEVRDVNVEPPVLVGTFKVLRDAERRNDGRTKSAALSQVSV